MNRDELRKVIDEMIDRMDDRALKKLHALLEGMERWGRISRQR
ncbi:MAG: hypothetical protein Q4P30_05585 [Eubacteriales bacterium]|nr:hypothetical protein [Eubacteriales bacterium]